ncbi:amylo-alpha-1,6-glucosidase, partial [Nocardia sp. GTS18]
RAGGRRAEMTTADGELLLHDRADLARGLALTSTVEPMVLPGTMIWRIVVPAGGRWQTEIAALPAGAAQRPPMQGSVGERYRASEPVKKIQAWRATATDITSDSLMLNRILRRSESDLGALQIHSDSGTGRPFVAAGAPWFMTLFGRDSLLTAWMSLPLETDLALGTLQQLAELQGETVDPLVEEEPGRIMHEMRRGPAVGQVLGGQIYYGTVDATPLFVMLLAECLRWGADPASIATLLPAADAAISWITDFGDRDDDGFVEYVRATDRGLINQGWKDSFDGINFASGQLAQAPIALCEVQGYVYAALLARAELADAFDDEPLARKMRERAVALRTKFAEQFWLPQCGWYAVALDGNKRQVDALTSNAAHCLWSGIATDEHAEILIRHLSSPEMDCGFGLRTLASNMGAYNPMSYHCGSVWPHDTAIAVAGLMRYQHVPGAIELATQLSAGLLDAAAAFDGRLPELFCGFPRGRFAAPVPYPTSCSPQAWASAAPLLLIRSFVGIDPDVPAKTLTVRPRVPASWGIVRLADFRLGTDTIDMEVRGTEILTASLPEGWELVIE